MSSGQSSGIRILEFRNWNFRAQVYEVKHLVFTNLKALRIEVFMIHLAQEYYKYKISINEVLEFISRS